MIHKSNESDGTIVIVVVVVGGGGKSYCHEQMGSYDGHERKRLAYRDRGVKEPR
jgi:hypothetical protein